MLRSRSLGIVACSLLLVTASACDSDDADVDAPIDEQLLESEEFALADIDDAIDKVDGSLQAPFGMSTAFPHGPGFHHGPHPHGSHLGAILSRLDLAAEQLATIRELMEAYREGIVTQLEGLREANMEILQAAEQARMEIREAFEAGEIGRDEALLQLIELRLSTRAAIRENPASEPFRIAICEAREPLFASIQAILDADQTARFSRWIASRQGSCRTS